MAVLQCFLCFLIAVLAECVTCLPCPSSTEHKSEASQVQGQEESLFPCSGKVSISAPRNSEVSLPATRPTSQRGGGRQRAIVIYMKCLDRSIHKIHLFALLNSSHGLIIFKVMAQITPRSNTNWDFIMECETDMLLVYVLLDVRRTKILFILFIWCFIRR